MACSIMWSYNLVHAIEKAWLHNPDTKNLSKFYVCKMLHKFNHCLRSFSFHYDPSLLLCYPVIEPVTVYSACRSTSSVTRHIHDVSSSDRSTGSCRIANPEFFLTSCLNDINLLKPNDIYIYIYIYIYTSYRSANVQTLHFKYLFNKYTYWIF